MARQDNRILDTLDQEKMNFAPNPNAYPNPNSPPNPAKLVQQLYRNELEHMLHEKERLKNEARQKDMQDKRAYNDRVEQAKEMDKLKQISYKNYYQMLMQGQQQNSQNYVSIFTKRDNMIDNHIQSQLAEGKRKQQEEEMERQRRMYAMKDSYKQELRQQLEEKNVLRSQVNQEREREKQEYEKFAKLPQELQEWERNRRKEEMAKYKEDLDKGRSERDRQHSRSNPTNQSSSQSTNNLMQYSHNPLSNPLPYNIQNPYILKELQKNNSTLKNASYLASIGNVGLQ